MTTRTTDSNGTGPKRRGRKPDPSKRDPKTGQYLSMMKHWQNRKARSFYLSQKDRERVKKLSKLWRIKGVNMVVRKALSEALGE